MNNRTSKKKQKKFTENRLEKKRITVAEQEKLRAKAERKKQKHNPSLQVIRAVRKASEPTWLTMVFSTLLNLFLGYGFSCMLTSTYSLPVNLYVFIPLLILLSFGMSYCLAQKEKLIPFLLAILLASAVWGSFMTDLLKINAQTRYAYSVLQQRVFHGLRPMIETAEELQDRRRDITYLLLLLNFIPTYFTSLTIMKRKNILISLIWYFPILFCSTVSSRITPDMLPCQLAVTGVLLLLIFQFVRRIGDDRADKRMLIIATPVLLLCLLIGGLFPQEGYTKNKLAASHFEELHGFVQDLGRKLKLTEKKDEDEEKEEDGPAYTGSITCDEEDDSVLSMNVASEDLSKVGNFVPPDIKIMSISRYYNDTVSHPVLKNLRMIYLRSTCMEVLEENSWRTYTTPGNKDLSYYYSEDNESPQSEADFVLRINTYFQADYRLVPEYTDHFYVSSLSKYSDLGIQTHTTWNLQENVSSGGLTQYDYGFSSTPQKAVPEWNPDYLEEEVYGVCLEVPEKTREAILKSKKLPSWYKELLDGTITMTTAEKVNSVVEYVRNLHPYDIHTPCPPEGENFVSWFINKSKTGFCVHYATTSAVLLRMIGVPTRYVTGYLTASDPFISSNEVSMKDAHAWFEFFDPDYGWVLDDATPGNSLTATYYNAYAINKDYGDMYFDFRGTPTPSPKPTLSPTPAPLPGKNTTLTPTVSPSPTETPLPTATPVPKSIFPLYIHIPPFLITILLVIVVILAVIGLLRLLYVLFWRTRFNNASLNRRAIGYNRYFNMHLSILEAPGSRIVRSIVQKAEYSKDSITEEELEKLIRFGQHNFEKQIPGRTLLRRMISRILRVRIDVKEERSDHEL